MCASFLYVELIATAAVTWLEILQILLERRLSFLAVYAMTVSPSPSQCTCCVYVRFVVANNSGKLDNCQLAYTPKNAHTYTQTERIYIAMLKHMHIEIAWLYAQSCASDEYVEEAHALSFTSHSFMN